MKQLDCIFRHDVRTAMGEETACCRMLEQIAGLTDTAAYRIPRNACEFCICHGTGDALTAHPVFPSLLLQLCDGMLSDQEAFGSLSRGVKDRLCELSTAAEAALAKQELRPVVELVPSCDVILCAAESSGLLRESIASALNQDGVVPFLHLVDTGDASEIIAEFSGLWNVRAYRRPAGTSSLAALHSVIESLTSPFIALHAANGISPPGRLKEAIRTLEAERAEIFGSQSSGCNSLNNAPAPADEYRRHVHPGTLVFRRSSFVDMGGAADVPDDDVEFLFRANQEGRKIIVSQDSLLQIVSEDILPTARRAPDYRFGPGGMLRAFARGFPKIPVACDVVLPFRGHLDYVTESLESLLQQSECDTVIHLVDDATPDDTSSFLQKWSQVTNVRTYRNLQNIGQFQSFNNVCRYFETPLCAVQDADDISLPHRLHRAGQMLHYTDADIFGGTVELFGDNEVIRPTWQGMDSRERVLRADIRRSFFPRRVSDNYFIENPTAVFRVAAFRDVGGFADFGDRMMNRASLDAEFQQRCLFHGVRFAISRDIVVRYRVHRDSATQDHQSGWGTSARNNAAKQLDARMAIFQRGGFDPRSFGSLGRYQNLTVRL